MGYDSKVWSVLYWIGVALWLVTQTITNPAEYGLTPIQLKWIGLAAILCLGVAGKLGKSYLGKSNGAPKIDITKLGPAVLVLALILPATSCATLARQPSDAQQQAKLQEIYRAAEVVERAGLIAEQAQLLEQQYADAKVIPASVHEVVRQVFLRSSKAVQDGLAAAKDITKPGTARVDGMLAAIGAVERMVDDPDLLQLPPTQRELVSALLGAAKIMVTVARPWLEPATQ